MTTEKETEKGAEVELQIVKIEETEKGVVAEIVIAIPADVTGTGIAIAIGTEIIKAVAAKDHLHMSENLNKKSKKKRVKFRMIRKNH